MPLYFFTITEPEDNDSYTVPNLPVEVASVEEARRLALDATFARYDERGPRCDQLVCGNRDVGWFVIHAHTTIEADEQATMLFCGTHPDQQTIEFNHALIRAGVPVRESELALP